MTASIIDSTTWGQHAWLNRGQTVLLLVVMAGFLALLGWLLWDFTGVVILLLWGTLLIVFNPAVKPAWIMRLYGATPLAPAQLPTLHAALSRLAERAGLRVAPTLHYIPSQMVNAFAVGRRSASAVAITDGFLRTLDMREQIGALAHEISHVRSDDMRVMALADMFGQLTRVLSLFGQILLLINLPLLLAAQISIDWFTIAVLIFAPSLSALAQLGLSRTREYDADLNAVRLTGDPEGMALALIKIERVHGGWIERLFLPGRRIPDPSLLRSHPPTEERVRRLAQLTHQFGDEKSVQPSHFTTLSAPWQAHPIHHRPRWHLNSLWY